MLSRFHIWSAEQWHLEKLLQRLSLPHFCLLPRLPASAITSHRESELWQVLQLAGLQLLAPELP